MRLNAHLAVLVGAMIAADARPAWGQTDARGWLSDAQTCVLARSVNARPKRLPELDCEPQSLAKAPSIAHPEWFAPYQLIAPDATGSVNRGFYAVNRITADTWELTLCKHVSSATIRRAHSQLQRKSSLSPAEWRRAARQRPCEVV